MSAEPRSLHYVSSRGSASFRRRLRFEHDYELGVVRGWKTFAIFATNRPGGYFGSKPLHDPAMADRVRMELGFDDYEPIITSSLAQGAYPKPDALFVGAYAHGIAIANAHLPFQFFGDNARTTFLNEKNEGVNVKDRILSLYPDGEVLSILVHSAENIWGYSLHRNGQLRRSVASSPATGTVENIGAALSSEESHVLSWCPLDKIDAAGLGEELVFEVTTRFLGLRLDDFELRDLEMTEFQRRLKTTKKPSALRRWLAGSNSVHPIRTPRLR